MIQNKKISRIRRFTPQKFLNGEIHNWYRIVQGYEDHLVIDLIDRFGLQQGQKVLDPFCGTGTTLIECMKKGIDCTGIEANPSSLFAAKVKTRWNLKGDKLSELLPIIQKRQEKLLKRDIIYTKDPTYIYLEKTGMIQRGWISPKPFQKAVVIKNCISELQINVHYKDILMLALIAEVVYASSNIKFGPELYCGPKKSDANVFEGFAARIHSMVNDLTEVSTLSRGKAKLILGDARKCNELLKESDLNSYSAVISSPPYPAEHDYTRNSRLELAFLEAVTDRKTLQSIKKRMIRSHTKGFYKEDNDAILVKDQPQVQRIVQSIKKKAVHKTHGFARLYPIVVQEYFGGMKKHLMSIKSYLAPHAACAYVVGDQSSYLQVHIPTAEIISSIASEVGFETVEIKHWRNRWSTSTSKTIDENILILKRV